VRPSLSGGVVLDIALPKDLAGCKTGFAPDHQEGLKRLVHDFELSGALLNRKLFTRHWS
jgi:hypothetical protein